MKSRMDGESSTKGYAVSRGRRIVGAFRNWVKRSSTRLKRSDLFLRVKVNLIPGESGWREEPPARFRSKRRTCRRRGSRRFKSSKTLQARMDQSVDDNFDRMEGQNPFQFYGGPGLQHTAIQTFQTKSLGAHEVLGWIRRLKVVGDCYKKKYRCLNLV